MKNEKKITNIVKFSVNDVVGSTTTTRTQAAVFYDDGTVEILPIEDAIELSKNEKVMMKQTTPDKLEKNFQSYFTATPKKKKKTTSKEKTTLFQKIKNGLNKVKDFRTAKKTRFLIQILLKSASNYLKALKEINTDIETKEKVLKKSTENKDLIELLDIEKTLVYFMTSLKANDAVLEKLAKGIILPLYEGDLDLLEDAIIENKQAIEMSGIYKDILSSITDTYATIISNNLNIAMKFLAAATIVLSIPTMISSFLGMNVSLGSFAGKDNAFILVLIIAVVVSLLVALLLKKKNML